jgi:hypothetical protein
MHLPAMLSSSIVPFLCVFLALREEQKQDRKMEKKLFVLAEKGSPIQNVMHVRPVGQALFGPTPSLPSFTVSIKSFCHTQCIIPLASRVKIFYLFDLIFI